MTAERRGVRLAEVIAALSLATDLAMGQPMAFALRSCIAAVRLGEALGFDEAQLANVYYQALLRYIGCNADTDVFAALFGDELALRRDFATIDPGKLPEVMRMVARHVRAANAGAGPVRTAGAIVHALGAAPGVTRDAFAGHCEVAQRLAERLGFNAAVVDALGQLYERWDGRGLPNGLKGEAIAPAVRVVSLVQDALAVYDAHGAEASVEIVRRRRGSAYDPAAADRFTALAPELLTAFAAEPSWDDVLALEPGPRTVLSDPEFHGACVAMADFADLKSPYTLGHSRNVAELAARAAGRCGLAADDVTAVERAGLLHDIGAVAVSSGIWCKPGALSEADTERARLHVYYTERVLARSPALARLGAIAAQHHERSDGSGYHRAVRGNALSPGGKVLAAADAYQAMTERRPHRAAHAPEDACARSAARGAGRAARRRRGLRGARRSGTSCLVRAARDGRGLDRARARGAAAADARPVDQGDRCRAADCREDGGQPHSKRLLQDSRLDARRRDVVCGRARPARRRAGVGRTPHARRAAARYHTAIPPVFCEARMTTQDSPTSAGLCGSTASDLARRIGDGSVSAAQAVEAHIERIERVNPALNAVVVKRYEEARAEARDADRRRAAGEPLGPLHGVPVTIKECLDVAGTPSTFGLAARAKHAAAKDDPYVARLRAAGAIVLGKTNVAQLLLALESANPVYGRTNNPWNPGRSPGGSSGGEGAIIAAGGSPLGIGTDIGGSVRIPAAFCGITSLKPTQGRTPDHGRFSVPIGQRAVVSQVGVLARAVDDVALGMRVIAGGRESDLEPTVALGDHRTVDVTRLRVAVYEDDGAFTAGAALRRAVREAAQILTAAGAQVTAWKPPAISEAIDLYFGLLTADRGHGIGTFVRGEKVDPAIAPLLMFAQRSRPVIGMLRAVLSALGQRGSSEKIRTFGHADTWHYWQLVERQMQYRERFLAALDGGEDGPFDIVLSPPCAVPAYTHGAARDLGLLGSYSLLANLLGFPAGVVPVTRVRAGEASERPSSRDMVDAAARRVEQDAAGLPLGVQIMARPWREDVALAAMRAIETGASRNAEYPRTPVDPLGA